MNVEIGDRVRIRHTEFPEDHMINLGWEDHENGPGWGAPIDVPSRQHWENAQGVVVGTDVHNNEVTVRGTHKDSHFTLVVPENYVEITEQGLPR